MNLSQSDCLSLSLVLSSDKLVRYILCVYWSRCFVVDLFIIGLTLPIGLPFICLTRSVSRSLQVHPFDPTAEYPVEHEAVQITSGGSTRTLQPRDGAANGSYQYPQATAAAVAGGGMGSIPIQHAQVVVVTATSAGHTLTNSPIRSNGSSGSSTPIPIAKATGVPSIPVSYSSSSARAISVVPAAVAPAPPAPTAYSGTGSQRLEPVGPTGSSVVVVPVDEDGA